MLLPSRCLANRAGGRRLAVERVADVLRDEPNLTANRVHREIGGRRCVLEPTSESAVDRRRRVVITARLLARR